MFKESSLILIATPIYSVAILIELIASNLRAKKVYSFKGVIENIYLALMNMGLDILIRSAALLTLGAVYEWRMINWTEGVVYWFVLLLAEDFIYYWLHRIDHYCRLFWAVHVTHHSSEEFNLTVGFRSSVFQPLYRFIYFIPLALLGFRALDIFLIYSITQLYGLLIHTQLVKKLGFLEWIMVTPSHHRVHHASNFQYLDRNFGMVFIFWDKLFGTFTPETEEVRYGLTKPINDITPLSLITHEWKKLASDVKQSPSLKDKIRHIVGRPNWVRGKDKTAA
ncbi:MAG TPA: sterol desaturase family protein [Chryseolinea sp.]|nr:sterol desaturase family protein [Chryseolinea sp.]